MTKTLFHFPEGLILLKLRIFEALFVGVLFLFYRLLYIYVKREAPTNAVKKVAGTNRPLNQKLLLRLRYELKTSLYFLFPSSSQSLVDIRHSVELVQLCFY